MPPLIMVAHTRRHRARDADSISGAAWAYPFFLPYVREGPASMNFGFLTLGREPPFCPPAFYCVAYVARNGQNWLVMTA